MENEVPNPPGPAPAPGKAGRVLVVEDDEEIRALYDYCLSEEGYAVEGVGNGHQAIAKIKASTYDVILSDIHMPEMDGLALLKAVRDYDQDVPVILITGQPAIDSAVEAVEYGALRYLTKPLKLDQLRESVAYAVRLHRMARLKRQALELMGAEGHKFGDRVSLEAALARALKELWMAYQPIVRWSDQHVYAYEALVRTTEPSMPSPLHLLDAAERLGKIHDLGRAVRRNVAQTLAENPHIPQVFLNLHSLDLNDEELYDASAPLSQMASRAVLEVTERAALDEVRDVVKRVARLKSLGFRIALDDLGAGYAGLSSFTQLKPDIVKLDMSLVRDCHRQPIKLKLVQAMIELVRDLGMLVVAEGVEVGEERDTLISCGCDLFQGYLFAKPGRPFPTPVF
jgi:EAL domain-containing protein (putative c-di-GMP-specific phosphodiesterase class I)/ActR/RegA family two-component response regulator